MRFMNLDLCEYVVTIRRSEGKPHHVGISMEHGTGRQGWQALKTWQPTTVTDTASLDYTENAKRLLGP